MSIDSDVLGDINRKLDELIGLKQEISELKKKVENIEEIVIEELSEEEKKDLEEALKEHREGKTVSLENAEKTLMK